MENQFTGGDTAADITPLLSLVLAALPVLYVIIRFEMGAMDSRQVVLISVLGALIGVARIPFAPLPNIQPCTFLIMMTGLAFGAESGFLVGLMTAAISNIFLGQGYWTIWQMLAWGIIGAISSYLRPLLLRKNDASRLNLRSAAVLSALYGVLYGLIMDTSTFLMFFPFTLYTYIAVLLSGMIFDIFHAAGNFYFTLFFGDRVYKIMRRIRMRTVIHWED